MIRAAGLTVRAGEFVRAGISFEIPAGSYAVLMGRTGSGKTTLLEALCGLRAVECGRITLEGRDVTRLPPGQRGIGYVPQDRALFPQMSVRENIAFGPRVQRWEETRIRRRVEQLAALLGVEHLLGRMPAGLSGGEQQRVALARALAFEPVLLLLDEPLSALDEETRTSMCDALRRVHRETQATVLHVTHSRPEAAALASVVLSMETVCAG